jgi:hypothetical protein
MRVNETISSRVQTVRDDASKLNEILSKHQSPNFEIGELRQLGIYPVSVEFTKEEVLKFEPCFFWPDFPPSLLSDYPICEGHEDNIGLDFDADSNPDSEPESEGAACLQDDAFSTDRHVHLQYSAVRDGFDDSPISFSELTPLSAGCVSWLNIISIDEYLTDVFCQTKEGTLSLPGVTFGL